jgi:porphobilinogen deaminase
VTAERAALARAEGGCDVAFGAHCAPRDGAYELIGMIERHGRVHAAEVRGADPQRLAEPLWTALERSIGAVR